MATPNKQSAINLALIQAQLKTDAIVDLSKAASGYGGKASGLAQLISWTLPVPEGVALAPDVFNFIANNQDRAEGKNVLSALIEVLHPCLYAVRSSVVGEDGESLSHAGIFDTVLGVEPTIEGLGSAIANLQVQTLVELIRKRRDKQFLRRKNVHGSVL